VVLFVADVEDHRVIGAAWPRLRIEQHARIEYEHEHEYERNELGRDRAHAERARDGRR
jgi:hypothetical protein